MNELYVYFEFLRMQASQCLVLSSEVNACVAEKLRSEVITELCYFESGEARVYGGFRGQKAGIPGNTGYCR